MNDDLPTGLANDQVGLSQLNQTVKQKGWLRGFKLFAAPVNPMDSGCAQRRRDTKQISVFDV